jgi:catechol 2,3-dioxygenase-like lactoylglutathione lyase family enzyme
MVSGGNATVFVSNMDAAVLFYAETLGLKLTNRSATTGQRSKLAPGSLLACIRPPQSTRAPEPRGR